MPKIDLAPTVCRDVEGDEQVAKEKRAHPGGKLAVRAPCFLV
jgi:hypothetical protein